MKIRVIAQPRPQNSEGHFGHIQVLTVNDQCCYIDAATGSRFVLVML